MPFDRAGLYVPGGLAVYPSSVIMAAAPAVVAGVKELVLCTPPNEEGEIPDAVLSPPWSAASSRIFKVGGAQAVFAMAYGTPTVPKCEIIAGPGNVYVTAAKQRVQERGRHRLPRGARRSSWSSPTARRPAFIAAELIGQAEHSPDTCCVLITTSEAQAKEVAPRWSSRRSSAMRAEIIRTSMSTRARCWRPTRSTRRSRSPTSSPRST